MAREKKVEQGQRGSLGDRSITSELCEGLGSNKARTSERRWSRRKRAARGGRPPSTYVLFSLVLL